jgi:citrate synthase
MTMGELHWKTAITDIKPNKICLRGYPLDKLMGKISFAQAIYLVLKGEFPTPDAGKLIDAIFVSSVDHGASPPSVLAARTVASTGAELNSAIAAGVQAISRYHGGAIEEVSGKYVRIARAIEKSLEDLLGKTLPINVDGAIAALLCELEISPEIGNAFFIIARVPGLVAHIHEEKTRMKPMRRIHPQDYEYDGPGEREIE